MYVAYAISALTANCERISLGIVWKFRPASCAPVSTLRAQSGACDTDRVFRACADTRATPLREARCKNTSRLARHADGSAVRAAAMHNTSSRILAHPTRVLLDTTAHTLSCPQHYR